jgi:hypothetical protein
MPIEGWKLPFNDKYINITRYDMPDASIQAMIDRTLQQAVKVVEAHGGKLTGEGAKQKLVINTGAKFNPPMEFCIGPMPRMEVGMPIDYKFSCSANEMYDWAVKSGEMPEGITFDNGRITGTPAKAGKYPVTLTLSDGKRTIEHPFTLLVRTHNIAPSADSILTNVREVNKDVLYKCWITFAKSLYADNVSVINDGKLRGEGSVFYSLAAEAKIPKVDYFGYEWAEEKDINMVSFHIGGMEEFGGWYSSVNVQYLGVDNKWHDVGGYTSTPALPDTDIVFFQPHFVEYVFEFAPVKTKAIRIIGDTKIQDHWNKYTKNVSSFISITELGVYEKE